MGLLIAIITVALVGAVVLLVSAPLRAAREARRGDDAAVPMEHAELRSAQDAVLERDELETAREAKYREIRDAELDYRTGKLSPEDYQAIDAALRVEALEILNRLERSDA